LTFLLCVAVFVAISCLGLPLLLLALFALWNPEQEQPVPADAPVRRAADKTPDPASVRGSTHASARRIDFSGTTV
jgi:hypothetical protein